MIVPACLHSMLETLHKHISVEMIGSGSQGKSVGDPL